MVFCLCTPELLFLDGVTSRGWSLSQAAQGRKLGYTLFQMPAIAGCAHTLWGANSPTAGGMKPTQYGGTWKHQTYTEQIRSGTLTPGGMRQERYPLSYHSSCHFSTHMHTIGGGYLLSRDIVKLPVPQMLYWDSGTFPKPNFMRQSTHFIFMLLQCI